MRRWVSEMIVPICALSLQNAYLKESAIPPILIDMDQMRTMRVIEASERETSPYAETVITLNSGDVYYVFERKSDIQATLDKKCYPIHHVTEGETK